MPNVRLLPPPPGSRASAAAARRAAAVAAQRAAARRSAFSRRGASGLGPADRAAYATRAQLAAVDAAAKQLFPLSLLTGAATSVYYVRAHPPNASRVSRARAHLLMISSTLQILVMGVGTVVGVALGALISTTFCALACQEVIMHSYDSRLLIPWLVFLALTSIGWAFALAEMLAAFAFDSGDKTLAATTGAVLASVATALNFKHRRLCAATVALCCCTSRRAPPQAAAMPQEAPAPAEAPPLAQPAAAGDASQLPV